MGTQSIYFLKTNICAFVERELGRRKSETGGQRESNERNGDVRIFFFKLHYYNYHHHHFLEGWKL